MALKDQLPEAYQAYIQAAGGIDKIVSEAFDAWAYGTGTVVGDKQALLFMADRATVAQNEFLRSTIHSRA